MFAYVWIFPSFMRLCVHSRDVPKSDSIKSVVTVGSFLSHSPSPVCFVLWTDANPAVYRCLVPISSFCFSTPVIYTWIHSYRFQQICFQANCAFFPSVSWFLDLRRWADCIRQPKRLGVVGKTRKTDRRLWPHTHMCNALGQVWHLQMVAIRFPIHYDPVVFCDQLTIDCYQNSNDRTTIRIRRCLCACNPRTNKWSCTIVSTHRRKKWSTRKRTDGLNLILIPFKKYL